MDVFTVLCLSGELSKATAAALPGLSGLVDIDRERERGRERGGGEERINQIGFDGASNGKEEEKPS